MSKNYKQLYPNLTSALVYVVIGLLFCIFRQTVVSWAMLVFGILLIVKGIIDAVHGLTVSGVISIVIGALLVILRFSLPGFIIQVFGIILAVSGISQLFNGKAKKLIPFLSCILTLAAGLLIVFFSGETLSIIFLISGILLIIDGVLVLFNVK